MHLMIYEDQSGNKIYDSKFSQLSQSKTNVSDQLNENIMPFFNRRIQLYIKRMENVLTIYCRIYANDTAGRVQGYYAVYTDTYNKDVFVNFKKDTDNVLQNLGLFYDKSRTHNIIDNIEKHNIIFNNIEKFSSDSNNGYKFQEDINIVGNLLEKGDSLEYKTGEINDIPSFCKKILEVVNYIDIAISTRKDSSGKGQIEILIDEYSKNLRPTPITNVIINKEKERIKREEIERKEKERIKREEIERKEKERKEQEELARKEKEGKSWMEKIDNNFSEIEISAMSLSNIGYNYEEIKDKINKSANNILSKIPKTIDKIDKTDKPDKTDKTQKLDKPDKTDKTDKTQKLDNAKKVGRIVVGFKEISLNYVIVIFLIIIATGVVISSMLYDRPFPLKDMIEKAGTIPSAGNDLIPPAGITALMNESYSRSYINWTWIDPTDPDFEKVMVFIEGSFKKNVTKGVKFYNATSLTPGTSYTIATRTLDTLGNINTSWINHTVLTRE